MASTKVTVSASLTATAGGTATLPNNHTWKDVTDWYVRWNTLHVEIGRKWFECVSEIEVSLDSIDTKKPHHATIYTAPDGTECYDEELDNDDD